METGKTPGHTDVMKAARLDKSMVVIFWPGTLPVKEGSYKIATSCRDGSVYFVCVCGCCHYYCILLLHVLSFRIMDRSSSSY
jgi:hypothetical protein